MMIQFAYFQSRLTNFKTLLILIVLSPDMVVAKTWSCCKYMNIRQAQQWRHSKKVFFRLWPRCLLLPPAFSQILPTRAVAPEVSAFIGHLSPLLEPQLPWSALVPVAQHNFLTATTETFAKRPFLKHSPGTPHILQTPTAPSRYEDFLSGLDQRLHRKHSF